MRDPKDPGEQEQVAALIQAYSYMGAPMVLVELARHYLKEAESNRYGIDYHHVCTKRAQVLLNAARELSPACCEKHRNGENLLQHCKE